MSNYSEDEQRVLSKEMSDKIYNDSYSTTEEELQKDTNWIEATKGVYKQLEGTEWSGSDEDAAKKGLEMMGRFNYNLTLGTINYTAQLQDADPKTKLDFYYMMDMYDKKDISGAGVGRAFKEMGLDPASYIGIGTLGMGLVGKQAATVAAKTGLKTMLRQGAIKFLQSPVAVAATEGAIYTGVDDVARQDAAIGAGLQDEYSPGQTAVASGIGAVAGAGIVKGTQVIGRSLLNATESINNKVMSVSGEPLNTSFFHQTTKEAEDSIRSGGFKITSGSARSGDPLVPDGIFFKPSDKDIGLKGKEQIPVELNIKNTFRVQDRDEIADVISKADPIFYKLQIEQKNIDTKFSSMLDKVEAEHDKVAIDGWDNTTSSYSEDSKAKLDILQDEMTTILDEWEQAQIEIPTKSRIRVNKYLKDNGFDGMIIENDKGSFGRSTKSIIAINPKQARVKERAK